MNADETYDKCPECQAIIDNEDYITTYESRGEFWGSPSYEEIVTGFKCKVCGYKEEY